MKKIRIANTAEVRAVNRNDRTIDVIASTPAKDSYGTRIDQSGWMLEDFRSNPVITWAHDDRGFTASGGRPIAKALKESIRVEDGKLKMRLKFPDKGKFRFADEVYDLLADGFLNAVSVGFEPLEEPEMVDEDGEEVPIYRHQNLLEVAVVTIPSNSEALAERSKQLNRDAKEMRMRAEFVEKMAEEEEKKITTVKINDKKYDPIRWNRSLGKEFDVEGIELEPSQLIYDIASKYMDCKVKNIYHNSCSVPSVRMGSFLMGLRTNTAEYKLEDVRNITYDGKEAPPRYSVIQLNSELSDDFLIDGISFYHASAGKFVLKVSPTWYGISLDVYTTQENKSFNHELISATWEWTRENNYLKGEAFSISGEFIKRSDETWDDVFLSDKNKKALIRNVDLINKRGGAFPNRGMILTGPPGTGKTLSGRIIRNTADASFIWISARDFYLSGSFGGLSYGFELARELAPSVLFIEDVDNWLDSRTIDLLKTEMDGIARSTGVLTILTTNFPERLPDALIDRPGRFHDILHLDLPSEATRGEMVRKWIDDLSDNDVAFVVGKTVGYSGAHIYELANFARGICEVEEIKISDAVREALKKIEEQKELITNIQLAGSNYSPRQEQRKIDSTCEKTDLEPKTENDYRKYFEQKQPINKIASKILGDFFKRIIDEKPPADEIEAWTRFADFVTKIEDKIKEEEKEKVLEQAQPEPAPKVETEEAPQPEQKASVQISLKALGKLSEKLRDTCSEAAVTASRKGVPIKDLGKVIDATGAEFLSTILPTQ